MSEPRTHLILGATGGIGSALARRLRAAGDTVVLAARNAERLEDLAGQLDAPFFTCDATSFASVENAVQQARERCGRLDGLANCVGSVLLKPAHLTSDAEWQQTVAQNLTSAFATVRAGAKVFQEHGGSIVLFSSAAARLGLFNHEAIAAAKAGVEGLVRAAAASYGRQQIRVNAIAPGLVRTPLTQAIWSFEPVAKKSAAMHALGRIGEPDDVASLAAWLLAPEQTWISGQVFGVDGGLGTVRSRE